jgi:CheY-like chemotaxis protein
MTNKIDFILFIDDDEAIRFLHRIMAEESNVTDHILEARGGKAGLEMLLELYHSNPNTRGLFFMDINMPVMNGWMVLDELRKDWPQQFPYIHIYMVTSSVYPKDLKKMNTEPLLKGHIPKPLLAENITEAAEQLPQIQKH